MLLDIQQAAAVASALGLDEHGLRVASAPGGDIAESVVLQAADATVFVKTLPLERAGLLSAEADGLEALAEVGEVRVPKFIRRGTLGDHAWLALEYLEMEQPGDRADQRLGRQLAALHRHGAEAFGWHRSNYIGLTPQNNTRVDDWTAFFADRRLAPQFDRLHRHLPGQGWSRRQKDISVAWRKASDGHKPQPSLIHGDLWRGNVAALPEGTPVIFDPSIHYADRECDLAMAHLFGGFGEAFYRAYEQAWPLPPGFETQRLFYQLYHLLNHANLFGGHYVEASVQLCRRIRQPPDEPAAAC